MISKTLPLMVARFCPEEDGTVARQLQSQRRRQQNGAEQDRPRPRLKTISKARFRNRCISVISVR